MSIWTLGGQVVRGILAIGTQKRNEKKDKKKTGGRDKRGKQHTNQVIRRQNRRVHGK